MTQCLNCGKEIIQTPHKKIKIFCNSTCRSNYWQKEKRKSAKIQTIQIKKENVNTNKTELSDFWKRRMQQKLGIKN